MIKIILFQDKEDHINMFEVDGHAGYSEYGSDIVCAAVSTLVINTINSLERLAKVKFELIDNEDRGYIKCIVKEKNYDSNLILAVLKLGLLEIEKNYKDYLRIIIRREP